jgi:hypothetical protein
LPPSSLEAPVTRPLGAGGALARGFTLVRRSARHVLLAYALNLVLAALLGAVVFDAVRTSLGSSLAGARLRQGWDARWYDSYSVQAQGVAATFRPGVAGPGGLFDGLDAFFDGFAGLLARGTGSGILLVGVVYLLSWSFLGAAFLGTFAERPPGAGFLDRGARWLPRVLPITVLGLAFYAVMLGPARLAVAGRLEAALHDVVDERLRLSWTLAAYAVLWTLVALGNLVLDYAKVLVVLRDERGRVLPALRALGAALRFVAGRPAATLALYALTALLGLVGMAVYVALVPIAGDASGLAVASTFLLGQILVLGRVALRALFLAGEVALASASIAATGALTAAPIAAAADEPPIARAV